MKSNILKYSIFMLTGFIVYFFIMKAAGLYTNVNLRIFNVLIHGTFVFLAMREYRKNSEKRFQYLETFAVGFRTSLIPVIGFAAFQFIYLQFINPGFMDYVHDHAIMGLILTPLYASIFLVVEGFCVSLLTSYLSMRYFTIVEDVPQVS